MNKDNPPLVSLHQGDYEENWWPRAAPDKVIVVCLAFAALLLASGLLYMIWSGL